MPTLREVGELEAIARLGRAYARAGTGLRGEEGAGEDIVLGIGDDAALLRPAPGRDLAATTDAFVEGRHYVPWAFTPRETGARLAHANLSDLAAVAAAPRWALLSLGLRADHDVDLLVELGHGLAQALAADGACVVGGNLAAVTGAEWLSLTLLGETPRGQAWTRAGARPGDLLAVTGLPGRAAAGLSLASRLGAAAQGAEWRTLLEAWRLPRSRVRFALTLAKAGAVTAATDISDGLAGNLARLCEASGVGAELEEALWPRDPELERAGETLGIDPDRLRLGPSDDYELLLAVDPEQREACEEAARRTDTPLAFLGRFNPASSVVVRVGKDASRGPLAVEGYDPFTAAGT